MASDYRPGGILGLGALVFLVSLLPRSESRAYLVALALALKRVVKPVTVSLVPTFSNRSTVGLRLASIAVASRAAFITTTILRAVSD